MRMNRVIKSLLFLIGLLLLVVLIYRVGLSEIIKTISKANPYFLFLGVLVYLILISIRSLKWFILIRIIQNKISYRRFIPFYLVNSLMGNLTPFKSGETVTPFLFKKYLKIPVGQGFSIIILDRFFELLILSVILVLSIFYILNSGVQNVLILSAFQAMLIVLFLFLAILVIVIISKRIIFKIVGFFRVLRFLEKELNSFYNALALFKDKKVYRFIILLTIASWFLEVSASYLVFRSIFSLPFIDIVVTQIIGVVATFITFIPGGMGIAEVSWVGILDLLGHSFSLTASAVLLNRLFLTGTILVTGLIGAILIKKEKNYKQGFKT